VSEMRIGQGFDVHQLVAGRRLVIGGVEIAHDKGLLGHSDADVLLHAICDALLGAAALGDIGRHFPDSDRATGASTAGNCCAAWRGSCARRDSCRATSTRRSSPRRRAWRPTCRRWSPTSRPTSASTSRAST